MWHIKIPYFILLTCIVLFCSCGEQFDSVDDGTSTQLSIAEASLMTSGTRSATTLNTSGDAIGLFLAAGTLYSAMDNVRYVIYGTAWRAASTEIGLTAEVANLCAYYPYYPYVEGVKVTIIMAPTRYKPQADLCYRTGLTASAASPNLSFTMKHAYSKLTINISKGAYSGIGKLYEILIENPGLRTSATLNIRDESITNVETLGSFQDRPYTASTLPATKEYLMVPSMLSGETTLSFEIDDLVYSCTIPNSTFGALVAGSNHTITVTFASDMMVVVRSVTTEDWNFKSNNIIWPNSNEDSCANCYMVSPSSNITIPVNLKGNGDPYTAALAKIPVTHVASSVGVLWQTAESLITTSFDKANQTATITAGSKEGNAVIAAYDTDGSILWSWHIWVTDVPAEETNNGNSWMDRNLGATARASNTADTTFTTCGGLFYQWGRKDPFPGSDGLSSGTTSSSLTAQTLYNTSVTWPSTPTSSLSGSPNDVVKYASASAFPISYMNQCAYSIKYPLLFLTDWDGSTVTLDAVYTAAGGKDSWGGEYGASKSIFDPCPLGWRVPSGRKSSSTFVSPWSTWTVQSPLSTSAYSAIRWYTSGVYGTYYYPAAGYREGLYGSIANVGCYGIYWSATAVGTFALNANFPALMFPSNRDQGFSVRCVREW